MFYNAKNGNVNIGSTDMDYVVFGNGEKNLILIPGLGDALKTVKGTAVTFAMMYRLFAKDYRVYVFSRKNKLPEGYTTKNMADDQAAAMNILGISKASFMGVSQGGMIAQYIALNYPMLVEKLILAVTLCRQNTTVSNTINSWLKMAAADNFKDIFTDTAEKTYTEKRLKKYRPFYPILSRISKPINLDRFIIQANACIRHDTYNRLNEIQCPTLVTGGDNDMIAGKGSSEEIAERIAGSKLILYKGLGHGAYEEARNFNRQVLDFLNTP